MSKDDIINNIPQCPGIYMIQNDINKKCYIGQSINLHKRLLHHINNYINNRYNAPIYKAFKKYGIDSFSLYILKTFDNYITSDIKQQLDLLEKQYIHIMANIIAFTNMYMIKFEVSPNNDFLFLITKTKFNITIAMLNTDVIMFIIFFLVFINFFISSIQPLLIYTTTISFLSLLF